MAVIALLIAGSLARADEFQSKFYDIKCDGMDGADLGRMLDALHDQLAQFFGKAPEGRLQLQVYNSGQEYEAAIRADGQPFAGGGGYYAPGSKKAYLFKQPSEFFTRQLILHEATHQFHFLSSTNNRAPAAAWFNEGLAEFFGLHDWDGKELRTGVIPGVSLEDYPAKALKQWEALKWDVEGVATGKVGADRPAAWALTHFLIHRTNSLYQGLMLDLNAGKRPDEAWKSAYGTADAHLVDEFKKWLTGHQQAWTIRWMSWQERGDWLEGNSGVVALSVLKQTPLELDVHVQTDSGYQKAGVVFGFQSTEDFYTAQLWGADRLVIIRRNAGKWEIQLNVPTPKAGPHELVLKRSGDKVTVMVDGEEIRTVEAPGQFGLSVDGCKSRFGQLKMRFPSSG